MRSAFSSETPALRALACTLSMVAAATAQTDKVRDAIRNNDLQAAVAGFAQTVRFPDVDERLAVCRKLDELAHASGDRELSEQAWKRAVALLEAGVKSAHQATRDALRVRCGTALARCLGTRRSAVRDPGFVATTISAARAMNANGPINDRVVTDLALRALPSLVEKHRYRPAIQLGEQALECPIEKREASEIRVQVGFAHLGLRKTADALPHFQAALARDPTDAPLVLSIVSGLPKAFADDTYGMLLPVVRKEPERQMLAAWQDCLDRTYAALDSLGRRRDPGKRYWAAQVQRRKMPQTWNSRIWNDGYRVWLPDNARPGKQYAGANAIEAALPVSAGWNKSNPPNDLVRWQNHALCFRRAGSATTFVVYWFGPTQDYWYGFTPRQKGVTSKTARGNSRGAIVNIVSRICYGEEPKRQKIKFKKTRPLPLKPGVSGIRKAWELDGRIYDETFFSVGQVTVEALLCIEEREFDRLKPEIEWLYRSLRTN